MVRTKLPDEVLIRPETRPDPNEAGTLQSVGWTVPDRRKTEADQYDRRTNHDESPPHHGRTCRTDGQNWTDKGRRQQTRTMCLASLGESELLIHIRFLMLLFVKSVGPCPSFLLPVPAVGAICSEHADTSQRRLRSKIQRHIPIFSRNAAQVCHGAAGVNAPTLNTFMNAFILVLQVFSNFLNMSSWIPAILLLKHMHLRYHSVAVYTDRASGF